MKVFFAAVLPTPFYAKFDRNISSRVNCANFVFEFIYFTQLIAIIVNLFGDIVLSKCIWK